MQGFILPAITAAEKCTLFGVKFGQSQWSVKCGSRTPGHGVWLKSVSRTITMQGFICLAITAAEKCTLFLDST